MDPRSTHTDTHTYHDALVEVAVALLQADADDAGVLGLRVVGGGQAGGGGGHGGEGGRAAVGAVGRRGLSRGGQAQRVAGRVLGGGRQAQRVAGRR